MCNCKKEIEAKYLAHFQEEQPKAEAVKASLDSNYALVFTNPAKMVGFMNITGSYVARTAKGKPVNRKISVPITFSYCPFCGEEIE